MVETLQSVLASQTLLWLIIVDVAVVVAALIPPIRADGRNGELYRGVSLKFVKRVIVGSFLSALGFLFFFMTVKQIPNLYERTVPGLLSFALVFAGGAVACAGAVASDRAYRKRACAIPPNVLDAIQQIEPDKYFETKKFFVFRKSGIYILLRKEMWGVHFVRLFNQTPVSNKKVKAPFTGPWVIRKNVLKDRINGLPMTKRWKEFTIPVDAIKRSGKIEEKYVKGQGILYYVSVFPVGFTQVDIYARSLSDRLDRPTILKVLAEISREKPKD